MRELLLSLLLTCSLTVFSQVKLKYSENKTLTYSEVIKSYEYLDSIYPNAILNREGLTDNGEFLKIFLISSSPIPENLRIADIISNRVVVLINNGIHPGESCGIDASLKFANDLLKKGVPDNVLIAILPVYNIGGALNRGCCSRANQNGPEMHGFRGNARNLDLNRDFIKADALNTQSFYQLFHKLQPHLFIDTHTSNGADYQYTMTLISTQKDKLNPVLSNFMRTQLEPALYKGMIDKGWEMAPYVNVFGSTPDKGYAAFLETPRYASGYTTLFNTIGFITETHMLKPYKDRVESTYAFLNVITDYASKNATSIIAAKKEAFATDRRATEWDLNWKLDSNYIQKREFKGYEYSYPLSAISGNPRLKYNRSKPKTYNVDYYDSYKSTASVSLPKFYIVPGAWREVLERLYRNNIEAIPLKKDTSFTVQSYYVNSYEFAKTPYEGHFPLRKLSVEIEEQQRKFFKGDHIIPTDQKNVRFLVSVLEPEAVDSYLRWNFFDEIFQQKEWFSTYVFEDEAAQLLQDDPELQKKFEQWKIDNPDQAGDSFMPLYFIYKNSERYEREHLRYPVARIE